MGLAMIKNKGALQRNMSILMYYVGSDYRGDTYQLCIFFLKPKL